MTEILHAWALAPAAIGTCCLAADRRRVRAPELAASVLMLLAMLDSAVAAVVAPVFWAALLLAGALGLAAIRRARGRTPRVGAGMSLHTGIGMVAMAALLLAMGHADAANLTASASEATSAHTHGATSSALTALLLGGSAIYAAGSVVAAIGAHRWLDRTQYAAMGASTLVMGCALLG